MVAWILSLRLALSTMVAIGHGMAALSGTNNSVYMLFVKDVLACWFAFQTVTLVQRVGP